MKAENAVARAQVFAGKRVPTTGRQYCIQKPKTKNQTHSPRFGRLYSEGAALGFDRKVYDLLLVQGA